MTRPLAIVAVLVLFVNDHVLKQAWPGLVTGKLSDIAGMIFFPLLLHTLAWTFVPRARRDARLFDRMLVAICVATAIAFALTKTLPIANDAYRVTWGAMLWPLRALRAIFRGAALPGFARVVLVRDPTDLVAVPFVALAWLTGRSAKAWAGAPDARAPVACAARTAGY
ncbi:MAG: hypothetical protein KF795_31250 [Labilithrix sp.]|nr:hypothetical protein [Labilithrix sp.]